MSVEEAGVASVCSIIVSLPPPQLDAAVATVRTIPRFRCTEISEVAIGSDFQVSWGT